MAARKSYNYGPEDMDGIPVVLYEGTATRGDTEGPDGLIIEDAITRQYPLKKGDLVKFYSDSNNPGIVQVEKVTLGSDEVNDAVGRLADDPLAKGDSVTVSGAVPAIGQRRVATMKAFGSRMEEFKATGGAIRAQYSAKFDESAAGVVEGSATLANGSMVAAAYTALNGITPVLMGYYGFHPED